MMVLELMQACASTQLAQEGCRELLVPILGRLQVSAAERGNLSGKGAKMHRGSASGLE